LGSLAVQARVHAVAVVLDFVQPVVADRRLIDKARQLRLDPFRRPGGCSHAEDFTTLRPRGEAFEIEVGPTMTESPG
jgi:hypothetical protein